MNSKVCIHCGTLLGEEYEFCPECGAPVSADEVETTPSSANLAPAAAASQAEAATASKEPAPDFSFCPECGNRIPGGHTFCSQCGQRVCPNCGNPVSEGSRFCAVCGTPVGETPRQAVSAVEEVSGRPAEPTEEQPSAEARESRPAVYTSQNERGRKGRTIGVAVVIIALVLVIIILVCLLIFANSSTSNDETEDFLSLDTSEEAAEEEGTDESDSASEAEEEELGASFADVEDSDMYYYDAVYALADEGIIAGISDTSYGIGQSMTRAQFVTIIWRIACPEDYATYENDATNESGLSDVADGAYYTAAVNWAVENGVVSGYDSGKFGVNDAMSFQDMLLIIARYAGDENGSYEAITFADADEALGDFTDGSSVSRYAEPGVSWCVQVGLVDGNSDGSLQPFSQVTRERAATVIYRAVEEELL